LVAKYAQCDLTKLIQIAFPWNANLMADERLWYNMNYSILEMESPGPPFKLRVKSFLERHNAIFWNNMSAEDITSTKWKTIYDTICAWIIQPLVFDNDFEVTDT